MARTATRSRMKGSAHVLPRLPIVMRAPALLSTCIHASPSRPRASEAQTLVGAANPARFARRPGAGASCLFGVQFPPQHPAHPGKRGSTGQDEGQAAVEGGAQSMKDRGDIVVVRPVVARG